MSSFVTAAERSVAGKITRSPLVTRRSRPPASTMVASDGIVRESTPVAEPVLSPSQALRSIADAGEVLSGSLDYEQPLRRVAVLAVPDFADWCAVYILGEGGDDEAEVSSGHDDPEVEVMLLGIRRARRDRDGASESIEVGESGKSILASDVTVSPTEEVDDGLYARLAPKSYMLVPLAARGRALGVADAALDPRRAPLRPGRPRVRRDARGPLRAGDRQRAAARRRRANADAARLR